MKYALIWYTVALLGIGTIAVVAHSQAPEPSLVGRVDRANNVVCYSVSRSSLELSCVHIPDGPATTASPSTPNRL